MYKLGLIGHIDVARLTDLGDNLFTFWKKYFRELDDICQSAQNESSKVTRLRFATFTSIAIYLGPLLLDKLSHHKTLSVSIMTNRSRAILESLIKKDIDLSLSVEVFKHPNLITHKLYGDYYSFYFSKKLAPEVITKQWLRKMTLIYMPEANDHEEKSLRMHIHNFNVDFKEQFELDSLEVVAEFTKKGLGIGILPNIVARNYEKELLLLKLPKCPKKFGAHHFYISYRDDLDIDQQIMKDVLKLSHSSVKKLYDKNSI